MDRLQRSAWQYVAEVLPPAELPMLAAQALVDGCDSPALRELAGLPGRSDEREIRELFVQALHELGVPLPDEETAGRRLLVDLAAGLATAELSPEDVAGQLSMTVAARTPEEMRFLSVAVARGEDTGADELPRWEEALRAAARTLTASSALAAHPEALPDASPAGSSPRSQGPGRGPGP
ncbi:hypothetical protein [Streptomyces sp. NPDC003456]|uniref:hypothetical protein n=1 Tax=Streptomyces sp. NPDC003456 TaxID=3364683 RepID=UPI00369EBDA9